jgi:hypothetical protein
MEEKKGDFEKIEEKTKKTRSIFFALYRKIKYAL